VDTVDSRARYGFAGAERYNAYRPGYPREAVEHIREVAKLSRRSTVVDLAAGSGLMTRLLSPVGRLIAVEPLPEMRRVLAAEVPEAEVLEGTAVHIPLKSHIADAVVVAQAFHWFANTDAANEISRVLKPEGVLALVWNKRDHRDPWMARLREIIDPYRGDSPHHEDMRWREVFAATDSPLTLTEHKTFSWQEQITLERLKGRVLSISFIALLDPTGQSAVFRRLEELAGSDDDQTPVFMKYQTEVFFASRR
jgi:SAM-dependent methyltransferase